MMTSILRTSERRDFLRCQQKWWWAWREGLRPKGEVADALWFGTGVHVALAEWYCGPGKKRGRHPAEVWEEWAGEELKTIKTVKVVEDEEEAKWVDAIELGKVMLNGYVALYGNDEHKLIIKPEKTFKLRVPWPREQGLYPEYDGHEPAYATDDGLCQVCDLPPETHWPHVLFDYCGTFDGVWRHADTGQLWLDEHKTAAQISTGHLSLDPQAGSYWAVATRMFRQEGLIGPNETLAGIEYNFLRKALPDERPTDAQGYATNLPQKAHYVQAISDWLTMTPEGRREQVPGAKTDTYVDDRPPLGKMKLDELVRTANQYGLTVLGDRSKVQPARNFERVPVHRTRPERASQLLRLQHEGLQMQALKDGVLPVVKNPDRTCNQGAFRCQFFEMCELHEIGNEQAVEDYKQYNFRVEDPYADHR